MYHRGLPPPAHTKDNDTVRRLEPAELYQRCDPDRFRFRTTAELEPLQSIIGQERAIAALQFGVGMSREGYNLYVLGPPGTGKQSAVRQYLEQQAAQRPRPPDWCYVNDFQNPQQPNALSLPAGRGRRFREELQQLVEDLRTVIPAAFEGDEYQKAVKEMDAELKERQERAFQQLGDQAARVGLGLIRTPAGFLFAPVRDGEVLPPEKVNELPESELKRLEAEREKLEVELEKLLRQIPRWRRETRARLRALNQQVVLETVSHEMAEIREHYSDLEEVMSHLDAFQQDVVEHLDEFQRAEGGDSGAVQTPKGESDSIALRYAVNLLVDNGESENGAPVIFEDNPTYQNLFGRVEHIAQMGALITNFTLIHAGSMHRACGGYLVVEMHKLLMQPFAWEGLKRALRAGKICIESVGQMLSLVSTVGLEPEPIPLDVKVVLIGERIWYYLLCEYDPDFSELFKVAADFEDRVERTPENDLLYARLIGTLASKEQLRHFDPTAVARVVEYGARLAEDAERISTHMRSLADLVRESDYWAGKAGRDVVTVDDVRQAIDAQRYRTGRVPERLQEEIRRGTILIDTEGEKIGQINGLSVIQLGERLFGQPSRITATARLGEGELVDIEREVELGGAIHSKGVLILSSFLSARFATDRPLSLSASLVFEQSYGFVEGDSASVAELCALLSALADTPIRQCLAVTGSVNQHGVVQAIGGVNEKIEGFFDICASRGLTGDQGVVIPASNAKHLMLREDVVDAVRGQRFSIYTVEHVDEAVTLLTGVEAGQRDEQGRFPEGTVNARADAKLQRFSEIRRSFTEHAREEDAAGDGGGGGDQRP
ncbi:MAG: ATP-binding protein [Gammaproteobacteria bacterium]